METHSGAAASARDYYPAVQPWQVDRLDVGDGHAIHVEQCGRRGALPVVFLHGGPGGGCKPDHRQFFDPTRYHVVLVDQRGAGRSTPFGGVAANTTQHLIDDLERVREHCGLDGWVLFGGSWGAALALAYAEARPERVLGMVLRGTFLARRRDVEWFYRDGACRFLPAQWAQFCARTGVDGNTDISAYLHAALFDEGEARAQVVAQAWEAWSTAVVMFSIDGGSTTLDAPAASPAASPSALAKARIEMHYAHNRYFLAENQLLTDIGRLPRVPVTLVHGARDLTCTADAAWAVHQAVPGSRLEILRSAGHLSSERPMIDALIRASDELASRITGA